jgi:hypothetical protein
MTADDRVDAGAGGHPAEPNHERESAHLHKYCEQGARGHSGRVPYTHTSTASAARESAQCAQLRNGGSVNGRR